MTTLSVVAVILILAGHDGLVQICRHPETGIPLPEQLTTLQTVKVTDHEEDHPGFGVSVGYNGLGMTDTVYAFTGGMNAMPEDVTAPETAGYAAARGHGANHNLTAYKLVWLRSHGLSGRLRLVCHPRLHKQCAIFLTVRIANALRGG